MTIPNLNDAFHRYLLSKIPDSLIKPATFSQIILAAGSNFNTGVNLQNPQTLGNPEAITIFARSGGAGTFQVSLSPDGSDWYHDTTLDIVFAGAADKVVKIVGAPFIRFAASTNLTGCAIKFQALYG